MIFPYYSIFNEDTGQLDASIFFTVTEGLRIGVQGVNLLNEVTKTWQAFAGDPDLLAPRSYFMNDRRYSLVLRGVSRPQRVNIAGAAAAPQPAAPSRAVGARAAVTRATGERRARSRTVACGPRNSRNGRIRRR